MKNALESEGKTYVYFKDKLAAQKLGEALKEKIFTLEKEYDEIVILCIGTDKVTGDSLGPIVGHMLNKAIIKERKVWVWGDLRRPVHAKNCEKVMNSIKAKYRKPFIIAVDAALSYDKLMVGFISVGNGGLNPGAFLNKGLKTVGNMHITGIVNSFRGVGDMQAIQNTRLNLIISMAEIVSESLKISVL